MRIRTLAACVLVMSLAASVFAEDLVPPNWRNNPGTQTVQWEFLVEPDNFPADYDYDLWVTRGYTTIQPVILHTPGPGAGWTAKQPTWENGGIGLYDPAGDRGDGWVNLSGELEITLGNQPVSNPHKEIWIQIVWEPQEPDNKPVLQVWDPVNGLTPETSIPLVRTVLDNLDGDTANPWRAVYHDVWRFDISPNPDMEKIFIRGGINIDEVVVDTWCVPEPASLSLLGLALVPLAWRRLRRK